MLPRLCGPPPPRPEDEKHRRWLVLISIAVIDKDGVLDLFRRIVDMSFENKTALIATTGSATSTDDVRAGRAAATRDVLEEANCIAQR